VILRLDKVEFAYPGSPRLQIRGMDLEIPAGAFVGIAGPNGAGKSTLLKLMAGLLTPRSGGVFFQGRPMGSLPRRTVAGAVAWAAQTPTLSIPMTVEEFVLAGRFPRLGFFAPVADEDRNIVAGVLDALELSGLRRQCILDVSGGERQLAVLARALAVQAQVLLLDEPLAHLDPKHHLLIYDVLLREHREGRTLLMTSHDYNALRMLADHLLLIKDGRILSYAPVREAGPEVWEVLFDAPFKEIGEGEGRIGLILPTAGPADRE
jgi:iron complex transport system ATP-binding protein